MADPIKIPGKPPANAIRLKELLAGIQAIGGEDDRWITSLQLNSQERDPGQPVHCPGGAGRWMAGITWMRPGTTVPLRCCMNVPGPPSARAGKRGVPRIAVEDLRNQLGRIASRFYRHPSRKMKLVGITGTNGKTTTAFLLVQALGLLGMRCAYSGTLGIGFLGQLQESGLTTVDPVRMHRRLVEILGFGAEAVCMEISSHGLDQGRANGVDFDVAVFTNLTRDHLDYHHSMKRYGEAKQKLFEFDSLGTAVINLDDGFWEKTAPVLRTQKEGRELPGFWLGVG